MSVSLGSTNIKEMYLGNTKIKEAYLGSTKVFGGEEQEEYLKISYDKLPIIYGDSYQSKTEYIDINNSNNIIDSSVINIMSSALGDPMPMPIVYVNLCNKDNGQYFALSSIYPEFSYDKINWMRFDGKDKVALQYGETVYIRSYKPLSSQSQANAITINTRNIDYSNIYNKTTSGGDTVQCYRCVSYGYKSESGNTFNYDYPLVSISGNLQAIVNYEYPDYVKLDSAMPYMFTYCKNYLYDISKLVLPWSDLNNETSAFSSMFSSCKFITKTPELPATTLAVGCYKSMFFNCSSLTTAPELPAMKMESHCYYQMFNGCINLVQVPEILPATTLALACYAGMFGSCKFSIAPELPAMKMESNCYYAMFQNCQFLVKAPELHSIDLADYCYGYMFQNCTSLINPPDVLPATTINYSGCYINMFQNCTSMIEAPDILALNIGYRLSIFTEMFKGCSSLNSIRIAYTGVFGNDFANWVEGVAASGRIFYDGSDPTAIPTGWTKTPNYLTVTNIDKRDRYISTINIVRTSNVSTVPSSLKYSYDLETWNTINLTTHNGISLRKGEKLYLWNSDSTNWSYDGVSQIKIFPGKYSESATNFENIFKYTGNIKSLINFSGVIPNHCFNSLFYVPESITAPGATLYGNPKGVKSINIALDGASSHSYQYLCRNNQNIKYPVSINENNNIGNNCYSVYYGMFFDCKSLVAPPKLPATDLSDNCYSHMFYGCINLKIAPELPATTLQTNCYNSMFSDCSSLTIAPELPANSVQAACYQYMFRNCSSLKYIKLNSKDNFGSAFNYWVRGVSNTGDFYYNGTDTTRGESAIPTGWTVHTF